MKEIFFELEVKECRGTIASSIGTLDDWCGWDSYDSFEEAKEEKVKVEADPTLANYCFRILKVTKELCNDNNEIPTSTSDKRILTVCILQ